MVNCFPKHDKCPKGFHSHEDDETGRCIPDKIPCQSGYIRDPDFPTCSQKEFVCQKHPELIQCGGKGGGKGGGNTIIIIKTIIHKTSSSHPGNSLLSKACFDVIKIAWLNNIHRGRDQEVDKFINKCLAINV